MDSQFYGILTSGGHSISMLQKIGQYTNGIVYDPDALAYFNAIGDLPSYVKNAINQRVLDFKSNLGGLDVAMWMPFPVTQNMFDGFREFMSNSVLGTQVYNQTNSVNPSPLYNIPRALAVNQGLSVWGNTTQGVGAFLTGFLPNTLTLNDTCWAAIYQDQDAASAGFNHGAFQSSTQSFLFQKRDTSNFQYADMYGSTTTSGRARYTGDGSGGVFIANRRSTTDFKLYKNGVQVASTSAAQGSLPTVEILLNGYKTNTTNAVGANENLGTICYYTRSLTPAEVALENASWNAFATAMKRDGNYDVSVIGDGDSHFAYWNSLTMRSVNWGMKAYNSNINGIAVSGQTLTAMITNQATNLYPKIQPSRGVYYLLCGGGTNDISAGSSAATTWANMQTYVANAKANASSKGVTLKAIMFPLYNRDYVDSAKILEQDDYNELLRNNIASGDIYVDFPAVYSAKRSDYPSDAAFIAAVYAFTADTNYFYDGTHLVDAPLGYPVPSQLMVDAIIDDLGF